MPIRAVVFDIGGVLEITPNLSMIEKWEQQLGLNPGEIMIRCETLWHDGSIGTISEADIHKAISALLSIDSAQVEAFMADMWIEYLGELNVELTDYFRGLRSRCQTAILSNSFVGAREREIERYHFDEMTDHIIYSHEVGLSKPDRRIYELTCERLNVQPTEMIFVDNVEANISAARELGIHAILFKDNAQAIADIEALLQG